MNRILIPAVILSLCLWAGGCKKDQNDTEPAGHTKMSEGMTTAVAKIEPTRGNNARGTVMLHQMGDKVHIVADISGLTPNQKHAIHIHEGTACGEDGNAAGAHYNPEKHKHGLPGRDAHRHAGNLGNLSADSSGKAHHEITVDNITISGEKNPILGRAVIVHAREDDGNDPAGNAGLRIGCGLIKPGSGK